VTTRIAPLGNELRSMKNILVGMGVFLLVGVAGMALDNDLVFVAALPAALITWFVLFFVLHRPR
jgi:hypothetical protein